MAPDPSREFNVAIVGAGFGGLAVAIGLKTKWGFNDFVGSTCDVPVHLYTLSTDPKPDWSHTHATQPEILQYMHGVVDKYGLRAHCQFHTSVDQAEWDADAGVWRIETRDVRTGEKRLSCATALVSAIGVLVVPRFPKLQGIESFEGKAFHSARWEYDVDLRGKRVGVLGNGSSASQFVPAISKDPSVTVVNFARNAMWYLSVPLMPYSSFTKWAFSHVPLVRRIYRFVIAASYEALYLVFRAKGNNYVGKLLSKTYEKYTKDMAPAKYHRDIIPTYPLGCKRLIRDQGYLESLNRPNVHLTFDRISRVEPDGVVTETGEKVPLDVIIYGTGFITDNYPLNVRGTRGTLKEYNDAHGGPWPTWAALDFPYTPYVPFRLDTGPNTTTGHTSVLITEETQVPYLLQLLEPVRAGVLKSVAPTDGATDRYNDMLQKRLENTAWSVCASWYRVGGRGRIFSTFPGPLVLFWWWLRKVRWEDYEIEGPGAEQWRRRHLRWSRKALFATAFLACALGALAYLMLFKGVGLGEIVKQMENAIRDLWRRFLARVHV
ncbi:FAD/NAD-P-binding domain-containing protein [Russula brevipes]|nr:FAD/NAD-P-binding domain-containing protein [Russula brevipes]